MEPHLLADARDASGLTIAEAAEHSGVSTASIRRYEQGKNPADQNHDEEAGPHIRETVVLVRP